MSLLSNPDQLDGMLTDYFRSKVPETWPVCPNVEAALPPTLPLKPRQGFGSLGRLALAAAISFLVVGYLALASMFPRGAPRGLDVTDPHLSDRPTIERVRIPSGPDAILWQDRSEREIIIKMYDVKDQK